MDSENVTNNVQEPEEKVDATEENAAPGTAAENEPKVETVSETEVYVEKKTGFWTKRNKIIVIAILAVAIIAAIIGAVSSSGSKFDRRNSIIIPVGDGEKTYYLSNGKEFKKSTPYITSYDYSADYSVMLGVDEDGNLYIGKGTSVKKSGAAKNIDEVIAVSYSGDGALLEDDEGRVLFYNVKSDKVVTMNEESTSEAVISPDGKTAAFTRYEDDEKKLYFFNGKKSVYKGKGVELVAMSNGGKYIYATNDALYVFSSKNDNKDKLGDESSSYYFNKDCTQVLFSYDGKTYISIKGKESIKLNGNSRSYPVCPGNTVTGAVGGAGDNAYIYGCENLLYLLWRADGNLYTYNKKGEKEKIASDVSYVSWTDDEKYVFFLDDETLCRKKVGSSAEAAELADDVDDYCVTSDGKYAYFIDNGGTLYSIKGKGKAKRIIDDADDLQISDKDVLFFTSDDALYSCKGTSKKKIADDASGGLSLPGIVVYSDSSKDNFYASNGSAKFKRVLKDLDL